MDKDMDCKDLNLLVKEDKYKVMKILGERVGYSFGTKGLKTIIDYYDVCDIDLNKLTDEASMKSAIEKVFDYIDNE